MRTMVTEKTVYRFDELSDDAKERALQDYCQFVGEDGWYAEGVIDDTKSIGALMGIEVDKVYFSGFSSQGDGACFEGHYSYRKGSVRAVKSEAPQDEELHRIARDLQKVQRENFYKLSASVKHRGHYYHEFCTEIDVDDERHYRASAEAVDGISDCLRDFMRWIYRNLEREYEYQCSEDVCRETSEANNWEYDEDGKIV